MSVSYSSNIDTETAVKHWSDVDMTIHIFRSSFTGNHTLIVEKLGETLDETLAAVTIPKL